MMKISSEWNEMRWYRIDWTSGSKSRFHCAKEASVCPGESYADVLWIQVLCARPVSGFKGFFQCCWALDLNPCMPPRMWRCFHWDRPHRSFRGRSGRKITGGDWNVQLHPLVKRNSNLIIFDFKMSPPNPTQTLKTFENPACWRKTLCNLGMSQPPFCNAFATVRFVKQCKAVLQCTLTVLVVFSHLIFLSLEKLQVSFARLEKYLKNHLRNSPMQLIFNGRWNSWCQQCVSLWSSPNAAGSVSSRSGFGDG